MRPQAGQYCSVVPHTGTWIEIGYVFNRRWFRISRPTWVRGLKCGIIFDYPILKWSHPTRVRGLKWTKGFSAFSSESRTHMGAWIEITT